VTKCQHHKRRRVFNTNLGTLVSTGGRSEEILNVVTNVLFTETSLDGGQRRESQEKVRSESEE
jgi:hypothetical protein